MLDRLTTVGRKNDFWQDLDGLIESVSKQERIVLGADLNGHAGEGNIGDGKIMWRYGVGTRNKEGSMIVDFSKRIDLAVINIGKSPVCFLVYGDKIRHTSTVKL